jgi:hypothetical protein
LARGGLSEFNNGSTGREYRKLFIRQMRHERAEKKGKINFMIRSMIAEERDGSKKKTIAAAAHHGIDIYWNNFQYRRKIDTNCSLMFTRRSHAFHSQKNALVINFINFRT